MLLLLDLSERRGLHMKDGLCGDALLPLCVQEVWSDDGIVGLPPLLHATPTFVVVTARPPGFSSNEKREPFEAG